MMPMLLFAGFVALFGVLATVAWMNEKKRTAAMQALAASMNFTFAAVDRGALLTSLGQFHLFSQGHARKLANVMCGSANGIDVALMDYRYTTGSGKNAQTHSQTVIRFRSGLLQLPDFTLRPERVFHRIGEVFGYKDIDFSTHPGFSKQYLQQGFGVFALVKSAE